MNSKFWKILTVTGLLLAIVVAGTLLFQRFDILGRLAQIMSSFDKSIRQTQEVLTGSTQQTEQEIAGVSEEDNKNLQRMVHSCFSATECIPPLNTFQFVRAKEASKFLKPDDFVIGVSFENPEIEDDPVKAYPLKTLEKYELVNDFINEVPVVVTYSPLTMAPRVYERLIDGKLETFGVSDLVLNSSPVIYDISTKSFWNQFDGKALTGERRDLSLVPYPSVLIRWSDWVQLYPKTVVLSSGDVSELISVSSLYLDYSQDDHVYFPLENTDSRLKSKDIVYAVKIDDKYKLYPVTELQKVFNSNSSFNDLFDGKNLILTYDRKVLKVIDLSTNQVILAQPSFYFVWEAFYPNTEIFHAVNS